MVTTSGDVPKKYPAPMPKGQPPAKTPKGKPPTKAPKTKGGK